MSRISNRQLVIAFLACRLSSDMITLPAAMVRYGTERFYAILLAKIVLLAVYLPVIFVSLKYKGDSVITAAVRRNKAFGVILGVIMTIIITAVGVQTILSLQKYVTDTLLSTIMAWSGITVITAAAVYGAVKGLSAVTRSAVFAAAVFVLLIVLIAVTMWDKIEMGYLYPAFINDGEYFLKCSLSEISMNSEVLIFAVITDEIRRKPHRTVLYYVPILLVLLEGLNLLYNLILGPYTSEVDYPLYIISSLSDIVIFQRLDGIDAVVWLMCGVIKMALLIYCVGKIYTVCAKKPRTNRFIMLYGVFLIALCLIFGSDKTVYNRLNAVMNSGVHIIIGGILVPLAVLIAGKRAAGGKVKNDGKI